MNDTLASVSSVGSSDRIFELIFESANDGMLLVERVTDGTFRYTQANPAMCEIVGVEREKIVGARPTSVFSESVGEKFEALYRSVHDSGELEEITHTNELPRGTVVTRSKIQPVDYPDGTRDVLVIVQDISSLVRAQRELETDRQTLRELYEVAGQSDVELTEQFRHLLQLGCDRLDLPFGFRTQIDEGVQTIREAVGDHPGLESGESAPLEESYCRKTIANDDDLVAYRDAVEEGFEGDPAYERFELGCYIGAKIVVRGEIIGTVCFADHAAREHDFGDPEQTFVRLLAQWMSRELDREALLEGLAERARTDGLTGLANRDAILTRLAEEKERADRYDHELSFLLLDLDNFKSINDAHGHWAGDDALRAVADLLDRETRASDLAGRYGGEEFAVVAPQTGRAEAVELAERIAERVRRTTIESDETQFEITCSVGVAAAAQCDELEELVMRADEALYTAKDRGRDQVAPSLEELEGD